MFQRLPSNAHIGRVRLRVRDLQRALAFYEGLLGLKPLPAEPGDALLSAAGGPPALIALTEDRRAPVRPRRTSGLFHFAILVPGRRDLARAILHLREAGWPLQGFADHAVSESLYLADPEANGIEIYADRPRSAWKQEDGELRITTEPLDLDDLLAAQGPPEPWSGLPAGTVMGHIHLEVTDLAAAEDFYSGVLGFDVTARHYPEARFLSAGGYHHHLAANVWGGARAPLLDGAAGLADYQIVVGDRAQRTAIQERLEHAGIRVEAEREDAALRFEDPFGIGVVITG